MSDEPTPYTTASDTPLISDVVSGRLIELPCPHCGEALRVLISDDGALLSPVAKTPPTDDAPAPTH